MRFSILSTDARQRKQEIALCIAVVGAIVAVATLYNVRSRTANREAAALCALAKVGAAFDGTFFTAQGRSLGFESFTRGEDDGMLILSKRFFARSTVACEIDYRDNTIIKTEVTGSAD